MWAGPPAVAHTSGTRARGLPETTGVRAPRSGPPIAKVAWRLGYSAPSAFHHAFRRWTGQSPREWRRGR
ncbi:helix-turn-helix transcriptional regulator [Cystobacter fuscus]|nr:helix-turn-helix transcriptional regulator [Cystobacter fuscus]